MIHIGQIIRDAGRLFRKNGVIALALLLMAAGPLPKLPPSQSDLDKIRYLVAVQEYIPNLFDHATTYETNLFNLLDQQSELVHRLEQMPEYRKNAGKRQRIELRIEPGESRVVNSAEVESWKKRLTTNLDAVSSKSGEIRLEAQLKKELQNIGKGSTQGFTTGLINSLPKEKRGELYSMNREQQIEKLQQLLPDDLSQSGFRGEPYGLGNHQLDRKTVLKTLKQKIDAETRFQDLIELRLALTQEDGQFENDYRSAKKIIAKMTEEKIGAIGDKDWIHQTIKELGQTHSIEVDRSVGSKIEQGMKRFFVKNEGESFLNKPLMLTEVPPELGLFRGYMGGDCSTQNSYGYVWGPEDRTFMVRTADGELKGYLSATHVQTASGEKALYLHSINGSRISTSETKAMVQGMNQIKKELGVKTIVLPSKNIYDLNNFEQVRRGITQLSDGGKAVGMRYQDDQVRDAISNVSEGKYELASSNQEGVLYRDPDGIRPLKISVSESKVQLVPQNISKSDGLLLAIDYQKQKNKIMTEKICEIMNVNPEEFRGIFETFNNPKHLRTAEYMKDVESKMKKYGVKIDAEFLNRRKGIIAGGILNASDAIAPEHLNFTKMVAFEQLDKKKPSPEIYQFLENHPELFRDDPKTIGILKKAMADQFLELEKVRKIDHFVKVKGLSRHLNEWIHDAENPVLRGNTLIVAGELKSPGYEKMILSGLSDQVDQVHMIAGKVMTQIISQNPESPMVAEVAKLLNSGNSRKNFLNSSILIMSNAVDTNGVSFKKNFNIHQAVFEQLASENPLIKSSAGVFWRMIDLEDNPKLIEYLKNLAMSDDPKTRAGALRHAMESKKVRRSKDIDFFLSFYRDEDMSARITVISQLSEKELLEIVKKEKNPVHLQNLAVRAGAFESAEMEKILRMGLESKEFNVLNGTLNGYYHRKLSPDAFDKIARIMLSHEDSKISNLAAETLFRKQTPESQKLLKELIEGRKKAVSLEFEKLKKFTVGLDCEAGFQAILKAMGGKFN